MKYLKLLSLIVTVFILGNRQTANAQNWQIGKNYTIEFVSSDVSGIFKELKGTIVFNEQSLAASKFVVSVPVSSINTGNALMNTHTKDAEWFDSATYPLITFKSKRIVKSGAGFLATGNLTIHGVTKEVSVPFTFKQSGNSGTFTGSFSIVRSEYKVGKPGGDVTENFKINLSIPVTKI